VAVTRDKAQQPSIRRVPTSLKEILDIAKTQLVTVTPRHKLAEIIPENLPMALADRQRIAQVLVNLVRNAAEHSPSDTTIEIVASTEEQTMIRIDVRDEGAGIPSAAKTSVFEAFRRGDDTPEDRKISGMGWQSARHYREPWRTHLGRAAQTRRHTPELYPASSLSVAARLAVGAVLCLRRF
jgi:K+-sensing histidine kinase KdpD